MSDPVIQGVRVKLLKVVRNDRGLPMEMLRGDEPIFERFGQVCITRYRGGVAKAWH